MNQNETSQAQEKQERPEVFFVELHKDVDWAITKFRLKNGFKTNNEVIVHCILEVLKLNTKTAK